MKAKSIISTALILLAFTACVATTILTVAAKKPQIEVTWIKDTPPDFEAIVSVDGIKYDVKACLKPDRIEIVEFTEVG